MKSAAELNQPKLFPNFIEIMNRFDQILNWPELLLFDLTCYFSYLYDNVTKWCVIRNWTINSDINECMLDNGGCDHSCVNKDGSFKCTCKNGYQLQNDKLTCEG